MPFSTDLTVRVGQLKVDELKYGETVVVTGSKIDPKGRPVKDVVLTVTVALGDDLERNNKHPFPGICKLWGVGVTSSNTKLLASREPHATNWVGNDIVVGERWQAGTCGGGRAIMVDSITIIKS